MALKMARMIFVGSSTGGTAAMTASYVKSSLYPKVAPKGDKGALPAVVFAYPTMKTSIASFLRFPCRKPRIA